MTQMSLATAAKEGIGSGPHHRSCQYLFLCREGVFSSRPQMGGIDWVQLCFSVWECLVGWHLGWGRGVGEPKAFRGQATVFCEDRHCQPLSLPADFVSL